MQFVPINYRQRLPRRACEYTVEGGALVLVHHPREVLRVERGEHTVEGGALVLVEKVLGADAEIDRLMVERYLRLKEENGYAPDDVDRKSLSLEGVLVRVTAAWNKDPLRQAGFEHIDCVWRWMNFCAWVAVR